MIGSYLYKQEMILPLEAVKDLKRSLENLSPDRFFSEKRNGRWGLLKKQPPSHYYINPHDSWFAVGFSTDGKVVEENITIPYRTHKNYETIKKVVCIALEWICKEMSWAGQTRSMSMSIMQHRNLQKDEETSVIPWHCDNSDHTLVVLLDDEKKWCGGDFLFKVNHHEPIRLTPKRGYGIFFSNQGTQHSVEPLRVNEDCVDRTILTIHEKQ